MTHRTMIAAAILSGCVAVPATAQRSFWSSSFGQGNMEYLTGEWDAATGGALLLNCSTPNNSASLSTQIAGQSPPPGSDLTLAVQRGRASQTLRFRAGPQGSVAFGRSASSAPLRQLWEALRAGDTVTIRYADGRSSVQSLAGAARTLPARPCG
ncbi:hypothetical protein [Sphingomonas radiodurans]|uniref:hypothetical protein n=1 Tax=Sphingomonas radiodurans TaxID=2890321 RepID=UPI001E632B27|nr:hypothetical protein [Sphingomonas radiodurans]WBH18069.1 hypothetical protein LLW23_08255 [Sphingomonas radiodurans]